MANSKQVTIRTAIAALFRAEPALAGGVIHENRDFTMPAGIAAQIHVNVRSSTPTDDMVYTGHPIDWNTEVEIVVKARRAGAAEALDAADAVWTDVYARLMADQSLGGLAGYLTPGDAQFEQDEADTSVASLTWTVTVMHRTDNNSLT